jgi:alcohol dehydrogenase class IV
MTYFEFATATRIIFGPGVFKQIGALASEMGWRALVTTGFDLARCQSSLENLAAQGVIPTWFQVKGEPALETIQDGLSLARREQCDLVIGFGGGSSIDTGKAIAALATNPGEPLDYLEVVGRGQKLQQASLPFIAVPTTAGTGSEVTRNAVIGVPAQRVKVSLRSPLMLPRLALVDPELTYSLPPEVTASTGLDALTQLIEPYVGNKAGPLTDAICLDGMRRALRSLRRAYEHGDDAAARQDMSLASLFGGLALANAGLGAVHGFAGVIGGMLDAPHGAICARLLPFVMDMNVRALQQRTPDHPAIARYQHVARLLTNNPQASAADGAAWLRGLSQALNIMPLVVFGLKRASFPEVIEKSARASSMQGNPVQLTNEEMQEILERAAF